MSAIVQRSNSAAIREGKVLFPPPPLFRLSDSFFSDWPNLQRRARARFAERVFLLLSFLMQTYKCFAPWQQHRHPFIPHFFSRQLLPLLIKHARLTSLVLTTYFSFNFLAYFTLSSCTKLCYNFAGVRVCCGSTCCCCRFCPETEFH